MSDEKETAVQAKPTETVGQPEYMAKLSADYPEIANALHSNNEALISRLASVLSPIAHQAELAYKSSEAATLLQQAPKMEERRPELERWIKDQPASLQEYYNTTLTKGSAQQRADVFNQFETIQSRASVGTPSYASGGVPTESDWEAAVKAVKNKFVHI